MPDIPRNTKTNAVVDLNTGIQLAGSFSGRLEKVGDHDWVRVELVAGQTYDFYLSFLETGSLVSGDLTLSLRNAGGNVVAFNNDGGGGETPNSVLSYTPTVGGAFLSILASTAITRPVPIASSWHALPAQPINS